MIDIRFERSQLNSKLLQYDMGEGFQRLVYELLREDYPSLHMFPSTGKDGGIDLCEKREDSSAFVECKYIGSDGIGPAQQRWREVAKSLDKNTNEPTGPSVGQKQYSPWYDTASPVVEYVFAISSILNNQDQSDSLREEIKEFFYRLSKRSHLSHLQLLTVTVLDWNDLLTRLTRFPLVLLRWFPRTRPIGLIPIEDFTEMGGFRSFLYSDTLPYYALHDHLKLFPAPFGSAIPNEDELLSELAGSDTTGLIITGKGGVGKTRLTLEIGRLARRNGWLVLRCRGNLSPETITQLAEVVSSDHKILIVADYIEVQRQFNEFVETVIALNDTYDLHIRYVANCRASFYRSVTFLERHKQLNLSPYSHEQLTAWLETLQQQIVRHILEAGGLGVDNPYLQICRNRPVFAVFMMYLRRSGRGEELTELLGEKDFSIWVAKRLQLSLGNTVSPQNLAELMTLFPLSDESLRTDELSNSFPILERLASDGWIEKPAKFHKTEQRMWLVAHDVLADQIVLSYASSISDAVDLFVQRALSKAAAVGSFRSALVTMQRIADQRPFERIEWFSILQTHISAQENNSSREDRNAVLRSSLLKPAERIKLLGTDQTFWRGYEEDTDFQNSIGWLARWAAGEGKLLIDEELRSTLETWLIRGAPKATDSNYLLSSGLRLNPLTVRDAAFEWISKRPLEHQTHYLIVAWLESGQAPSDIELAVWQWTRHFMYSRQFSFVASAWLDAKGDRTLISDALYAWLEENSTRPEAFFIYRSWLDADGESEVIEEHLISWLDKNAAGPGASSVYMAWLKHERPPEKLTPYINTWLDSHASKVNAGSIFRAWLTHGGKRSIVEEGIRSWLEAWGSDPRAEPIYSTWLRAGGDWSIISEHIHAWIRANPLEIKASFVYQTYVTGGGDREWLRPYLERWINKNSTEALAGRVYRAWLDSYREPDTIRRPLTKWLESYSTDIRADFVYRAWIRAEGEFEVIVPYVLLWLEPNWESSDLINLMEVIFDFEREVQLVIPSVLRLCREKPDSKNSLRCLVSIISRLKESSGRRDALKTLMELVAYQPKQAVTLPALWTALESAADDEIKDAITTVSVVVIRKLLASNATLAKHQSRYLARMIGVLLLHPKYASGEARQEIDDLFVQWIRYPGFRKGNNYNMELTQLIPDFFHRMRELISGGVLAVDKDRSAVTKFLRWMNVWPSEIKLKLKDDLDFLRINCPANHLWDRLQMSSESELES